ncbi:ORF2 [Lycalopex gymnocercus torque teno virus 1]|nr:ORF2 [Lycalopex gymnocercus torque teno virus 1]
MAPPSESSLKQEPETPKSPCNWSQDQDKRAKMEAVWLRNCSETHALWCTCGEWISHIRGIEKQKCRLTDDYDPLGLRAGDGGYAKDLADAIVADMQWDMVVEDAGERYGDFYLLENIERDNILQQ